MAVDRKNSEGYSDPTACHALTNVEREERSARKSAFRPIVYICSPFAGNVEKNTENARRYSRFAVEQGYIPIAPHLLLSQYLSEEHERGLAMFMNNVFLGKCAEIWVFGSSITQGMSEEIEQAERMRKKIRYFTEDLQEVARR